MKSHSAVMLGLCLAVFAGAARADDNDKKIVGVWVIKKSASALPPGSTIEFTRDGKINAVVKDSNGDLKFDGTYKVEKDKIFVELKVSDKTARDTLTIRKLTDDILEVEDRDKKVDTFKKKVVK